jgi:hypothetical protein
MTPPVASEIAALPPEPPSEVEWEELLVRVEVAPRALRLAVDDAPHARAGVRETLRQAFLWEARLQTSLASMAGVPAPAEPAETEAGVETDPADAVREIGRLRARSFAMVQRRGLGVWRWRASGGPFAGATAYQLLAATVQHDRRTLDAVRAAAREG